MTETPGQRRDRYTRLDGARRKTSEQKLHDWMKTAYLVWGILHRRALAFKGDTAAELQFLRGEFFQMITCGICRANWAAALRAHPPDLTSADAYFRWTVDRHNDINALKKKPTLSYQQAMNRWLESPIRVGSFAAGEIADGAFARPANKQ